MSLFKTPDPPKPPPPPPPTPVLADVSKERAVTDVTRGYTSLVSTSPAGLKRKASTVKRSLIGGGGPATT